MKLETARGPWPKRIKLVQRGPGAVLGMPDRHRGNQNCAYQKCRIPHNLAPGQPQSVLPLGFRTSSSPCTKACLGDLGPLLLCSRMASSQGHLSLQAEGGR